MFGILGLVFFAVGLPAVVADHSISDDQSGWVTAATAGVLLVVGWLAGIVLVKTVHMTAIGLVIGGALSATIGLFNGERHHVPGLLLMAAVGVLLFLRQDRRMRALGETVG